MRASMPLRYVKAPVSSGSIGRNRERKKAMKKMNLVLGFAAAASLLVTACGSSKTETTAAATEAATTAAATEAAGEIPADAVTATGTAKGNNGDVTVEVTMTKDKLYKIEVTEQQETEGIGDKAIAELPSAMIENNSVKVDAVSGATNTSNAIIEAVKAAIKSAGFDPADFENEIGAAAKAEDQTLDADVVIVGAGGAGMTAAIEAADAGKTVVLVESQAMVGGNSVRATGGLNAAKTKWQDENEFGEDAGVEAKLATAKEKYADNADITALAETVEKQYADYQANPTGYFDSVELFELDTMIGGKGLNNFELVKTLCSESADAIDWLDTIGAEMHNVGSFGGASVKRIHRPVDENGKTVAVGAYLIPILEKNIEDRENITLLLDLLQKIIRNDGIGTEWIVTAMALDAADGNEDHIVLFKIFLGLRPC